MIQTLLQISPPTSIQEYGFSGLVVTVLCGAITMGFKSLSSAIRAQSSKLEKQNDAIMQVAQIQTEAMNHLTKVVSMMLLTHIENNLLAKKEVENTIQYVDGKLKK